MESARANKHGSIDLGHLRDREVQSSPIAREEKRPSSGGGKGMGVKGMEEVGDMQEEESPPLTISSKYQPCTSRTST